VTINNLVRDIYKNVYAVSENGNIIIKLDIIYNPINFLELNVSRCTLVTYSHK